jgi:hypothetical protein
MLIQKPLGQEIPLRLGQIKVLLTKWALICLTEASLAQQMGLRAGINMKRCPRFFLWQILADDAL